MQGPKQFLTIADTSPMQASTGPHVVSEMFPLCIGISHGYKIDSRIQNREHWIQNREM